MDYKETIKERLAILPEGLKAFVLNENWRKDARQIGTKFKLDEEKYASLENEIFLVLLCFEKKENLMENLKSESGLDSNITEWIVEDVNKNIFNQITNELNLAKDQIIAKNEPVSNQNGVGQSFEQIILNQARAMRPAVAPENLPTEMPTPIQRPIERPIEREGEPHTQVPNYSGNDPYREPPL